MSLVDRSDRCPLAQLVKRTDTFVYEFDWMSHRLAPYCIPRSAGMIPPQVLDHIAQGEHNRPTLPITGIKADNGIGLFLELGHTMK